jgi:hypothetical protein
MVDSEHVERCLQAAKAQVWAIVYAYNPPARPRSLWYDRWRYDVINDYVEAVSFLGAEPLIIDVDNFIVSDRLRNHEIARAINLNSGATPISNIGVVPSIAAWHDVACFPNPADVLLSGERKDICKSFFAPWFNIPPDADFETASKTPDRYIFKPKTMGNSQQVVRSLPESVPLLEERRLWLRETIIEEFIEGYEVTVPVIFDNLADDYVVLPPVLYVPEIVNPTEWFLSYQEKMNRKIKIDRRIGTLDPAAQDALRQSSRAFNFKTLARFDFRWRTSDVDAPLIDLERLWFLEINCMPTLRADVNFLRSVKHHLSTRSDSAIDYVKTARNPDTAALAYLLLQFHLGAGP